MKKSFPFYYEIYIAGTALLSHREKGAYVDLLCYQADKTDKGKGHLTFQDIRDILNSDFDCWEKLKSKFIEENGFYYNKKLESVKRGKQKKTEEEIAIDQSKFEHQLNEKRLRFYNDCRPYLGKYSKDMLRKFYNYWTELNKSGTKMRFELQQTFEIGKRLATWAGRDKEFIKNKEDLPSYKTFTWEQMLEKLDKAGGVKTFWTDYKKVKLEGMPAEVWIHINDIARYNIQIIK